MCGGVSYVRSAVNSLFFTGVLHRRLISGIIRGRVLRRNARRGSVPAAKMMFPGSRRGLKDYFIPGLCLISEILLSDDSFLKDCVMTEAVFSMTSFQVSSVPVFSSWEQRSFFSRCAAVIICMYRTPKTGEINNSYKKYQTGITE